MSGTLLIAPAASAQEPPSEGEKQKIVVVGDRGAERQASESAAALAAGPGGKLARFESEVCPGVVGLGASQKAAVERRLRSVAKAAGITLGKADCAPNAILMLADDKRAFVEKLQRERPEYFGDLPPSTIRRLVDAPGPAVAWQLQGKVNSRGVPITAAMPGAIAENRTIDAPSRIAPAARSVLEASAVVIEKKALAGLSTTQLADYAAMRLFAHTDPDRLSGSAANTIVTILDAPMGTAIPLTLTERDIDYLRGLYSSRGGVNR